MSLLAVGHLETLISNTAIWQSLTGAASASAARAFIHQFGKHAPAAVPPYIALTNRTSERTRVGTHCYHQTGAIRMVLELPRRSATYPVLEDEYVAVQTDVDTLQTQMLALAGTEAGGIRYLEISRLVFDLLSMNDPRVPDTWKSWKWNATVEWP